MRLIFLLLILTLMGLACKGPKTDPDPPCCISTSQE